MDAKRGHAGQAAPGIRAGGGWLGRLGSNPRVAALYGALAGGGLLAAAWYRSAHSEAARVAAAQRPEDVAAWQRQMDKVTGYPPGSYPTTQKWTVAEPDDTRSSFGSKSM